MILSTEICKFLRCVQSVEISLGEPSFVADPTVCFFGWKLFVFAPKAPGLFLLGSAGRQAGVSVTSLPSERMPEPADSMARADV